MRKDIKRLEEKVDELFRLVQFLTNKVMDMQEDKPVSIPSVWIPDDMGILPQTETVTDSTTTNNKYWVWYA